jgi:hypothetical protein
MSQIKVRDSRGANPAKTASPTYISGGWQAYEGAGLLRALVLDHVSTSGNVLKAYDTASGNTSAPQLFTRTSETDAGTTIPITMYTDGDLPAGTSTDNVKAGIPFARGLFFNKTGDTTNDLRVIAFITPLIKKSVNLGWVSGAAGSGVGAASVFSGPGLLHGIRIKADTLNPSTADFLVKDSPIIQQAAGTGSGNQLLIKTDYTYAAEAVRPVVTLTGCDEGGTAVSTAATGAYASPGIFFTTGLNVTMTGGNVQTAAYQMDFLIEA